MSKKQNPIIKMVKSRKWLHDPISTVLQINNKVCYDTGDMQSWLFQFIHKVNSESFCWCFTAFYSFIDPCTAIILREPCRHFVPIPHHYSVKCSHSLPLPGYPCYTF